MKKRLLCLAMALLLLTLSAPVAAESFRGGDGWKVTFTKDGKMTSSFHSGAIADAAAGLQPGDDMTFMIALQNENAETISWYMANKVLYSLEDRSRTAAGGAYTYRLSYMDPKGTEKVLFSNDAVGGEQVTPAGEGLHGATSSLEEFFYLDTMTVGQSGSIMLQVALDGESQGNNYQDTLADLEMTFAAELTNNTSKPPVVSTGDETNLFPYYLAMTISGALLLVLAIVRVKKRGGENEHEAE